MTSPAPAASDLDRTLAALADPVRRQAIDMLRRGPRRPAEMAAAFDVSLPVMSKHLRVLRQGRLIEEMPVEDDARMRLYRLRPEPFDDLGAWLEEVQAFWSDQLDAFKDHVARRRRSPR
ncbi:winged helix-turn-helix transcriptional regulator [Vineibacter terrae]|uniref:Winged helix-turn-helix transcriptional regulator n=1 Tax=Vineibacter terrae TaxID=2586908 RepID=A0A5C8PIA5_9HYPH|nr:metalloregulator ArsR/SmtB family transcription factor [Vineibacter terrae]TXL72935.1 winged helix-turn-helix transcriptional regulator [Vineibacter terrae]